MMNEGIKRLFTLIHRQSREMMEAINILRIKNKPLTHYAIAKMSGVSFNTVKKKIKELASKY